MSEKNQEQRPQLSNREKRIQQIADRLRRLTYQEWLSVDTTFLGFKSRLGGFEVRLGRKSEQERQDYYLRASTLFETEDCEKFFGGEDAGVHILHNEGEILEAWIGSLEDVEAMEEGEPHEKGFPQRASDTQLLALQVAIDRTEAPEGSPLRLTDS